MREYTLRHKDNIAALLLFNEDEGTLSEVLSVIDEKFLPLCSQNGKERKTLPSSITITRE